jgi:hypothetical protein
MGSTGDDDNGESSSLKEPSKASEDVPIEYEGEDDKESLPTMQPSKIESPEDVPNCGCGCAAEADDCYTLKLIVKLKTITLTFLQQKMSDAMTTFTKGLHS